MLRGLISIIIASIFFFLSPSVHAVNQLTEADVQITMEEIFSYHVEFKEISPLIVRRAFKLYIEQFDPEKNYLLQDEVKNYLSLGDGQVNKIIQQYKENNFSSFEALNETIQKAIARARKWREEMERELIINFSDEEFHKGESYLQFVSSKEQLKQRVRRQLIRFVQFEKNNAPLAEWTPEMRQKVFVLMERRLARMENPYLYQKQQGEHYLALHILKAMAKSLDAHTAYYSPEEAYEMRTALEKQFEGIGVILREGVEGIYISDLVKGGPAEKSGKIAIGDFLVEINGRSVAGDSYDEILIAMKSDGKKSIQLGLKRREANRKEQSIKVTLVREKIVMQDERLRYTAVPFADGWIGRLDLPSFYESSDNSSCEQDIREAIKNLKKKGKLLGLIVDLRENSGGFLNQAVKATGLFITSGVIVISKYSKGEVQYLRDIDGRLYYNGPLVVLTSKGSASAAEILAQALQDYGAALIVGDERTYGKGTIQYQTLTDDDAKAFFKVTVGKYYTVSGRSTQIEGVEADIIVPTPYSIYHIGERYLEYPLTRDRVPAAYIDPLTDLDRNSRGWFQKNYLPNLQKKELKWRNMLSFLQDNSGYRLKKNKNFQLFLQSLRQTQEGQGASVEKNWGVDDLQMGEAVSIVKDMILMQPASASSPPAAIK